MSQHIPRYVKLLIKDLKRYLELRIDYLKLESTELLADLFARLTTIFFIMLTSVIIFTFLLLALAFYLGKILNGYHYGFMIVSGIFLVFVGLFFVFYKKIVYSPILNFLVRSFWRKDSSKKIEQK